MLVLTMSRFAGGYQLQLSRRLSLELPHKLDALLVVTDSRPGSAVADTTLLTSTSTQEKKLGHCKSQPPPIEASTIQGVISHFNSLCNG